MRVSTGPSGAEANGTSSQAAVSADGRYVAFRSEATNLVTGDFNSVADVFVRDLVLGETVRVSLASDGTQAGKRLLRARHVPPTAAMLRSTRRLST